MTASPLQFTEPGALGRDLAISRVYDAAPVDWLTACRRVIRRLALEQRTFSTDDVWTGLREYDVKVPEPRAMGAVMRQARHERWITPLNAWKISTRPACHCRPVRLWIGILSPGGTTT